ncbi:mCG1027739 [Mus musculus]|nr:mCG1027739 [Mus musculus]
METLKRSNCYWLPHEAMPCLGTHGRRSWQGAGKDETAPFCAFWLQEGTCRT